MMPSRPFLLVTIGILCYFVSWTSAHAYFSYPTPRIIYCTNSSCTSNGTLNAQGPVWALPANSSFAIASPTSQTTCNGSTLLAPDSQGITYDPGFQGTTVTSWPAGSSQTLAIFVSQIHSTENQIVYPTDGWQIRYRDGAQPGSTFSPIAFVYANVSTVASVGPAPAIGFQLGQTVFATITVPSGMTSNGIFQFFWRNNEVGPGVMWLSCADVTITAVDTTTTTPAIGTTTTTTALGTTTTTTALGTTTTTTALGTTTTTTALGTTPTPSTFSIVFVALLAAVSAALRL